jgi:hypothetical protein
MRKTGIWNALNHDLEDTINRLAKIHQLYKKAKTHADLWRNDFLGSLAEAKASKNDTTVEVE